MKKEQKHYGLRKNYFRKRSGQALAELAIFGSLTLLAATFFLSYGMRINYDQNLEMRTFRSAMQKARANFNTYATPYVRISPKTLPQADSPFGQPSEKQFFISAANIPLYTHLRYDRLGDDDYGDRSVLPKIYYEIDGRTTFEFTCANFAVKPCPASGQLKKAGTPKTCAEVIKEAGDATDELIEETGEGQFIAINDYYDVDDDGKEEFVLYPTDEGNFAVIDSQEGEIDMDEVQALGAGNEYMIRQKISLTTKNTTKNINNTAKSVNIIDVKYKDLNYLIPIELNPKSKLYYTMRDGKLNFGTEMKTGDGDLSTFDEDRLVRIFRGRDNSWLKETYFNKKDGTINIKTDLHIDPPADNKERLIFYIAVKQGGNTWEGSKTWVTEK